ncbi:MAG: hypothetical protein E6H80_09290 [Betaproteobacteria bacterium]|nr:MAG: hypothetical protein E6H80_09290 [Betaproteobacteria bacterium]
MMRRPIILTNAFTLLGEKNRKIMRCLQLRRQWHSTSEKSISSQFLVIRQVLVLERLIIDGDPFSGSIRREIAREKLTPPVAWRER